MGGFGGLAIRQNYNNTNLSTRGLNLARIIGNPVSNTLAYFYILGAGTQQNRIYNYYKRYGIPLPELGLVK